MKYYLVKSDSSYVYHVYIVRYPDTGFGEITVDVVPNREHAMKFTRKNLAKSIANALRFEIEEVYSDTHGTQAKG